MKRPYEFQCEKLEYDRRQDAYVVRADYEGDEPCEVVDFLEWASDEGGFPELLRGHGSSVFPVALQAHAQDVEAALDRLEAAITQWATARGVQA